jgi:hypothetical protein
MAKVNLDALVSREDFEVEQTTNSGKKKDTISIEDIKADSFFFTSLRKPDFQRETNEWDVKTVVELIRSFVEGELIPAVILWRSKGGYLFVIDGSHRLSALAAWVNNDFGDGAASKHFYDGVIPDEQLEIAEETRRNVNKVVGSYEDLKLALSHPEKVRPEVVGYARNLAAAAITLQWVEGDAGKAEKSFFKINQQAAPIDKTELRLLEQRRRPFSIASRAIIRSGKGHKYWSSFADKAQEDVQSLAAEVNKILFAPKLTTPIKTLDIPLAGKVYAAASLPLILDMVGIVGGASNDIDDATGEITIRVLSRVREIVRVVNSNHPSSLGLHPIVYFYSAEGRHKSASFLATIDFVCRLNQSKRFDEFTLNRSKFEDLIWRYDYLVSQINRKYRTAQKSYEHIARFYLAILSKLNDGKAEQSLLAEIQNQNDFNYLKLQGPGDTESVSAGEDFTTGKKSAVYIREALACAPKCAICGGLIHRNSISIDHIERKQDGGMASIDNGQITHPYCNTGYKN